MWKPNNRRRNDGRLQLAKLARRHSELRAFRSGLASIGELQAKLEELRPGGGADFKALSAYLDSVLAPWRDVSAKLRSCIPPPDYTAITKPLPPLWPFHHRQPKPPPKKPPPGGGANKSTRTKGRAKYEWIEWAANKLYPNGVPSVMNLRDAVLCKKIVDTIEVEWAQQNPDPDPEVKCPTFSPSHILRGVGRKAK